MLLTAENIDKNYGMKQLLDGVKLADYGVKLQVMPIVAGLCTAIAACISRALYKRTGNIWTAAFINGLLMTIMTLANTTVFFK